MTVKKAKTTKKVKNSWALTTIPVHSWITFWVLVLATMALATVCFTDAFKNSEGEVDQETVAAFEAIRKNLEAQVADLQTKVGVEEKVDGRLLIAGRVRECDLSWATSTAEVYVSYVEPTTKVRMSLPYSFNWGNAEYALLPVAQYGSETSVEFGPSLLNTDCYTYRDSMLLVSNSTSTPASTRRSLANPPEGAEATVSNVRERTINGIPVLSYRMSGATVQENWIGFGRNFQYRLSSYGWLTDAEAVKIIQSLRVEN